MFLEKKTLIESTCKSGMSEKTAGKYRDTGKRSSALKKDHTRRILEDPFGSDWPEVRGLLKILPKPEALTICQ